MPQTRTRTLPEARRVRILEALHRSGSVSVIDFAKQLGVSEMTVRRDLTELARLGKLARTHGGAVLHDTDSIVPAIDFPGEPSFRSRLKKNATAKLAIAKAAVAMSADTHVIALDVGTTIYMACDLLADRQSTKFFTHSVRNAVRLADGQSEIYLPGGRVRNDEMSIATPGATAEFGMLWFDIAFIGVSGLTEDGIFDYSFEDTEMKRIYLGRSNRKVVLCDSSKFGLVSLVNIGPLSSFDHLITDAPPPSELAAKLSAADVELLIAV